MSGLEPVANATAPEISKTETTPAPAPETTGGQTTQTKENLVPQSRVDEITKARREAEEERDRLRQDLSLREEEIQKRERDLEELDQLYRQQALSGKTVMPGYQTPDPLDQLERDPQWKPVMDLADRRVKPVRDELESMKKLLGEANTKLDQLNQERAQAAFRQQLDQAWEPVIKETGISKYPAAIQNTMRLRAEEACRPILNRLGRLPNATELRSALKEVKKDYELMEEQIKKDQIEQLKALKGSGSLPSTGSVASPAPERDEYLEQLNKGQITMDQYVELTLKKAGKT